MDGKVTTSDLNPYAPPQVDCAGDNGRTIEISFVADEPLIVDTAAERKRKRYWAVSLIFMPMCLVLLITAALGLPAGLKRVPPSFLAEFGQALIAGGLILVGVIQWVIDRSLWYSLRKEAAREIAELQRRQPVFQYGTWHVRLGTRQVVLITPGGEISWPLESLRRLEIRTHRHRVNAALFWQTTEFMQFILPIPRNMHSAEPFENLAALAKARISGET